VADWLALPFAIFADDAAWVAPLTFHERRRISPRYSPFFKFADVALFLAYRGSAPVGRISAQVNRRHLERHHDSTGHFGFFDCLDDPEAARALVAAAESFLRARNVRRMVGPMNFSLNEECGCLISGFDISPAILMPHARSWTGPLLEGAGLGKEIDLFAYRMDTAKFAGPIGDIAAQADRTGGVSVRPFDMANYDAEVRTLVEIFNDAWDLNWGFVPFSSDEIDALLAELKPLIRGNYGRFVLFDRKPVAMMVGLPNINEIIAPFHGRLLPFNWAKLLWTLKREDTRSARVPLLGLRRAYQSSPIGGALLALLVRELITLARTYRMDWVEFSWVLETNRRLIKLAEMAAGPPVKIYRLYSKSI